MEFKSGRNVCIYYLLDMCKFGDVKCIYSHSKQYLDEDGWWNDESEVEMRGFMVRTALEVNKEQREFEEILWQIRRGKRSNYRRKREGFRGGKRSKGKKRSAPINTWQHPFTDSEVEELLCQGVKPWDDDAWVSIFPKSARSCI
jgi:hypothetical protein